MAFRKRDFRVMDVSRAILRSQPLKRDTYVQLPKLVEDDRVAWKLPKPLYGLSTSCRDWYRAIMDFLLGEWRGKVTALGKSVFFWAQQGFEYEYVEEFRGKNPLNLGHGIFKINDSSKPTKGGMLLG